MSAGKRMAAAPALRVTLLICAFGSGTAWTQDLSAPAAPAAAPAAAAAQRVLRDCPQCPELIVVDPGTFLMGSSTDAYEHDVESGESPPFSVTIREAFALGRFEVTQGEFAAFKQLAGYTGQAWCGSVAKGDTAGPESAPSLPARCLTQADAIAYTAWLSVQTGHRYRLPSESEWEYAVRAGTRGARFWSARHSHEGVSISQACDYANVYDVAARELTLPVPHARCTDGYPEVAPVGTFLPNPWGFHDLIGNVRERVADCFTTSYKGRPADERAWVWADCRLHAVRGGSWMSRPLRSRSAARDFIADDADSRARHDIGLRVARELSTAERAR